MVVVGALLFMAGIINVLPVVGVLSAQRLEFLYGVPLGDPNLTILLRHRAVLFGLLGVFMLAAAFVPPLQPAALTAGGTSMLSFAAIAVASGGPEAMTLEMRRVLTVDVVGLVLVALAALVRLL